MAADTTVPTPLRPALRRADDIARSLASDFERALYARLGTSAPPDPVLASLFQAFASQVGRLYEDAENAFPVAVLDDLMAALGQVPRLARPAQTVVQFTGIEAREVVTQETEFTGYGRGGEPLTFACDDVFAVAPVSLAFAGVVEGGRIIAVPGARVPDTDTYISPGSAPLREQPVEASSIVLALDIGDAEHLSETSVFLDVGAGRDAVVEGLSGTPWILLDSEGRHTEAGVMRPSTGPGGVRRLQLGARVKPLAARMLDDPSGRPVAPAGPYAGRVFVFPAIPSAQRWRSMPPAFLRDALRMLLPPGTEGAMQRPLAWLYIPMPAAVTNVAAALQRVAVNCMTASNLETWSEHVPFDRIGSNVHVRPEGRLDRSVMGILSVTGEQGEQYVAATNVAAPERVGRFHFRAGQLDISPGRSATGKLDRFAAVRLILTDAGSGNGVGIGELRHLRSALGNNPVAQVNNLAPSRGGEATPPYAEARLRFANALRTRDRFVTAADLEIAARAFDLRIADVAVRRAPVFGDEGVRMSDAVTVTVRRNLLVDAEAETAALRAELEAYLTSRVPAGRVVTVTVAIAEAKNS